MQIHTNFDNLNIRNAVVTTGSFDGVHHGHKYIINRLNSIAKSIDGESVLITFYPHPRKVLYPDSKIVMINSQKEKIETLKTTGLNHLIIAEFTREFSQTKPADFIKKYLVEKVKARKVVIGYDHNFGHNKEGNFDYLYELGKYFNFEVEEIMAQDVQHVSVSSTKIRQALQNGEIQKVNAYLGHNFFVIGKVIPSSRFGRRIGFKTACVEIEEESKLIPTVGVYAVTVKIDDNYFKGLAHISPLQDASNTLIANTNRKLNVHILDFDQDIYDKYIKVTFIEKIREQTQFYSLKSLINQIKEDAQEVKQMLKCYDFGFAVA